MAKESLTRTIEIEFDNDTRERVSGIPSNAKITFGPVTPGAKGWNGNALRIYTSQQNQLAVFQHVRSFRDLSLTLHKQRVNESKVSETTRDKDGLRSSSDNEVSYEWETVAD